MSVEDFQKPIIAVLGLGAAATAGFVAGFVVGRDPETARKLARTLASGVTRTQVTLAETWESLGDMWAEAREQARSDLEDERFGEQTVEVVAAAGQAAEQVKPRKKAPAAKKKQPKRAKSKRRVADAKAGKAKRKKQAA